LRFDCFQFLLKFSSILFLNAFGLQDVCIVVGKSHDFLPLDELVSSLVEENITAKMVAREEELESLFKLTSKASSEYDSKTSEMLQMLEKARQEQVINSYWLLYKYQVICACI
jgi:hypothetical protein